MSKACKSNAELAQHGKRESNTLVIYLDLGDNPKKFGIIPNSHGGT